MSNQDYSIDVALSFAGEDREYAEELAQVLRDRNIKVFYDAYEEATLWGKNLYNHLSEVYQKQAYFCVMFLSRHYASKVWTNHEREAAQARAFQEKKVYILPIRLDDTEIPGILPTIGYLRWSNADSIANAIVKKLEQETPNQDQIEREYKYLINKVTFKKIETFIKTTTFDSKYKLGEVTEVVNHDYYFDTIAQQLFKKKASLRFRIKIKDNQKELILTLKSEHKTNGNSEDSTIENELHQRLEIEGYPNIETLKKVQIRLSQLGVLNSDISDINDFDLIYNGLQGIFSSWNLKELFKLENKRMSRSIIDSGNKIAEIAFDKVDLKIDNQDSTFYEIEVEAKVNGATKKITEIVQFLKQEFSTQLIPSEESKYERGLKFLRTKAYDKIETKLIILNQNEDDWPDFLKSLYPNDDYNLGLDVKSTITDIYYDTKNRDLFKNKFYLRIRDQGKGQKIVTLRENNLTDVQDKQDKPMTSRSEIKGSIDQDSLTKVIDSLIASKFIKRQRNNEIIFYNNTEDFLKYYGLEEVVKIQTERVLFPISHKKESLGSMKYDIVKFIFPKITKIFDLKLIEVSTSDTNNIIHLETIKYYLMHHLKRKEFNLKESNEPKYKIGLDLLKDYQISQNKLFERKPFQNLFSTRIKNLSIAQPIVLICITLLILMIIGLTITAVPLPR